LGGVGADGSVSFDVLGAEADPAPCFRLRPLDFAVTRRTTP
jgi:hypothetical protein